MVFCANGNKAGGNPMKYLTSGNPIVDAMGEINITGNVTPQTWYKTILRENGKPYLLAIAILPLTWLTTIGCALIRSLVAAVP